MNDVIDFLPFNSQDRELIPVTTYKLTATIRNNIFNYKQIESMELAKRQSPNDDVYSCNCENSEFCDPDYVHIITGDLRLIKNHNPRKLRSQFQGVTIFYSRYKKEVHREIEEFAGNLGLKHKLEGNCYGLLWVSKVKEKVKNKMKSLKKSTQIFDTYSVMPDEEIRQYLKDLRTKFCIVSIDKALNNLSFICMKFMFLGS